MNSALRLNDLVEFFNSAGKFTSWVQALGHRFKVC